MLLYLHQRYYLIRSGLKHICSHIAGDSMCSTILSPSNFFKNCSTAHTVIRSTEAKQVKYDCQRSLDQRQKLLNIFLSKKYILVVQHHTWHTHNIVLVLNIFKIMNVIYMSNNTWIRCGNSLSRHHQIRTHGAGKCDQYLHIGFVRNGCDLFPSGFIQCLSRACSIVQSQHKEVNSCPLGMP